MVENAQQSVETPENHFQNFKFMIKDLQILSRTQILWKNLATTSNLYQYKMFVTWFHV